MVVTGVAVLVAVSMVSPGKISGVEQGPHSLQAAIGHLPGTTSERSDQTVRSALQLGHVDMAFNGVHVELTAHRGPDRGFNAWQHPCLQSLLTPLMGTIPSDASCAVRGHGHPVWELLVSPRYATVPPQSARFRWAQPLRWAQPSTWPPFDFDAVVDGHPAWVRRATGRVRYPCDSRWTHRVWTSIYFPEQDAEVSILAPSHAGVAWLAGHISVD